VEFFKLRRWMILCCVGLVSYGCTGLFYASMKRLGKEKRDILVSRISDGKKEQEKAAEQFQSAYEAFQSVTQFHGGDLEEASKKLTKEYEKSRDRANKVHEKIEGIDKVGRDLFREWSLEIDQMGDSRLKLDSKKLLRTAETRHERLIAQMRVSEERMKPVLRAFQDQTLFLKHNLNARAIASLKGQVTQIGDEVQAVIDGIKAANLEADKVIAGLVADSEG
jgi:hypothetical protein